MVVSSFSPAPCGQKLSTGSTHVARTSSSNHTELVVTTNVDPESEPETHPVPEASRLMAKSVGNVLPSQNMRRKDANVICTEAQSDVYSTVEDKRVDQSVEACSLVLVGSRRRKDRITPPSKLSERIEPSKSSKTGNVVQTTPRQADLDMYTDWAGGSRYEVDKKPWNILGWLTEGFKKKLQRK